jgi:hypothetical protein
MVFDEIIRFEIELWNGVDARLKADCSVPVTHFEPMSVMDRLGPCRVQGHRVGASDHPAVPASWSPWRGVA